MITGNGSLTDSEVETILNWKCQWGGCLEQGANLCGVCEIKDWLRSQRGLP